MDQLLDRGNESSSAPEPFPEIRTISAGRPLVWLAEGLRDIGRTPLASLGMGLLIALVGAILLGAGWKANYVAPAMLGGFLLVAPFLALPLYALSAQHERGERSEVSRAWGSVRGNAGSIALFGLVLMLAYIVWERLAAITFALFYRGEPLNVANLLPELFLSGRYNQLLLAYFAIGALLAGAVFALSVVTAPLLLDRPRSDTVTAMLTSVQACLRNAGPLLLWALLLAGLTLLGFLTLTLGFVLIFPLLAHASWHAYRDLVAR
ncbi:DUF2189 domain-containing protein [Roseateles violae]|uniref:DUF2189 domain-containing protein n=1 Tax=Roseateles violae TaxID=3058042 RepID=A0ABT8DMN8_9BURK|nr:DUF2189 domain-containing protein [Pelomonas sp. PFR6]MDN3919661.1 DUF2189 domain-containing protein [Pelomonas sp. PFR6]